VAKIFLAVVCSPVPEESAGRRRAPVVLWPNPGTCEEAPSALSVFWALMGALHRNADMVKNRRRQIYE